MRRLVSYAVGVPSIPRGLNFTESHQSALDDRNSSLYSGGAIAVLLQLFPKSTISVLVFRYIHGVGYSFRQ